MKFFGRFFVSLLFAVVSGLAVATSGADETTNETTNVGSAAPFRPGLMRIDFSLTSVAPTHWDGEIRLSRGSFADAVPLGVDPTCATSFFFADTARTRIGLQTVAPTTFCGFEATLFSPRDARIDLKLRDRATDKTIEKTVLVERLIDSSTRIPLDDAGSGVFIVRAPADELPVRIEKLGPGIDRRSSSTVFQPGETFRVSVLPRSSATRLTDDLTLTLTATPRDGKTVLWSESRDLSLAELRQNDALVGDPSATPSACDFVLDAPEAEGVFQLTIELTSKTKTSKPTFALAPQSKRPVGPIARRVVQGVVAPRAVSARTSGGSESANSATFDGNLRGELLETIDPTNPSWRKTFSKRSFFPSFLKTSGANGEKNDSQSRSQRFPQTFADVKPAPKSLTPSNADALENATVLGQEPTSSFGKNLFGFVFPQKTNLPQTPETERAERSEIVRQWASNRFQTFYPQIDRRAWGLTADLWEKTLSGGNSSVLNGSEISRFASAQNGFIRLDPNGTPPRRVAESAATKIAPVDSRSNRSRESAQSTISEEALGTSFDTTPRVSWEAYPIPVREPGKPHLLEIEYPSNVPQTLGIAVLEPSPSGGLFETTLDVGLVVGETSLTDRAEGDVSRYSVLFWPKTKAPTILLTNRSSKTPALYGQIRVYRADADQTTPPTSGRGRLFGVALTQPTICDQFSAVRQASPFGVLGSEDWTTFDDATTRALQYLAAANFDSAIFAVAADGTALYPSELLNPTPRCDGGVFLPTGGDPVRKDVLELALAKFEASRTTLIPLLRLNAPLPELERRLREIHSDAVSEEERAKSEGIEPIGPDGRLLVETRQADDGTGPYYNVLHPEVQRAILNVVRELTTRCGSRESFGGLALDVGAGGWLALPDDVYFEMDDETIGRFVRESNLSATLQKKGDRRVQELLFAQGPERYRFRAEFIRDVCLNEWVDWRCDALAQFYREIRATVAATRPDARLYLVATTALDGPVCRSLLYPSLRQKSKLKDALRLVGLDPTRLAADQTTTLLRPEIVASTAPISSRAASGADEFETPDGIAFFSQNQSAPGTLFYHRAEKRALPEFDAASPYRPTILELETRALPADFENRRRFARQLASGDALFLFDGGDCAPSGQEETLRDWIDAFRRLPAVPFESWTPKTSAELDKKDAANDGERSIQPLVVRFARNEKETWVYLVNAAPFHVGVKLSMKVRAGSAFDTFAGSRPDQPLCAADDLFWNFTALPFDLVALRLSDPKATVEAVDVSRPDEICGSNGRLSNEIQRFVDRILAARSGVSTPLRNGDFEESFVPFRSDANVADDVAASVPNAENAAPFGLDLPKMNFFKKSPVVTNSEKPASETVSETAPFDPNSIPGWRAFGPDDVVVRLDETNVRDGRASLLLESTGNAGGVLSQPFVPPTTGRLCLQISFGVPIDATETPLRVCLTGRRNGQPYLRRLLVGPTILERARKQGPAKEGDRIIWVRDVVLFDRLPLDGLEQASLRFDLLGAGRVWLDDVRLYKLAFAADEQNELMRVVSVAEFRVSKERVLDSINLLDGYWAKLLKEEIPDDAPELASRRRQSSAVAAVPDKSEKNEKSEPDKTEKPKSGFDRAFQRLKFW